MGEIHSFHGLLVSWPPPIFYINPTTMKKTYSELLKDPRWQKKRLQVLNRDKWTCKLCKDSTTTLHVHHKEYSNVAPWEYEMSNFVTLCEHCHYDVEILVKDLDADFDDIKIHKSNNWNDGSRIMTICLLDRIYLRIYDSQSVLITGYSIYDDVRGMMTMFKTANKAQNSY